MIDLKLECDSLNIDINDLIEITGTPRQTLKDWCIKHPKRIHAFLDAIRYSQSNDKDLNNALSQIERYKVTIDTLQDQINNSKTSVLTYTVDFDLIDSLQNALSSSLDSMPNTVVSKNDIIKVLSYLVP